MKKFLYNLFAYALLLIACYSSANGQPSTLISASKQLMVVVTGGWDNIQGTIYIYQKRDNKWVLQFSNPVVVGSKGLGIGDGVVPIAIADAPIKKEGDKKSPAGIFTIGTAFGYADYKDAKWINNPYIKATDTLICVDDPHSASYNTLIKNNPQKSDYNSFEHMLLAKDYYRWGLFINHNAGNSIPGDGSCVFMHIWGSDHEGTAGCTAMSQDHLLRILHWIKADDHPLLVQLPKAEYAKMKGELGLPSI